MSKHPHITSPRKFNQYEYIEEVASVHCSENKVPTTSKMSFSGSPSASNECPTTNEIIRQHSFDLLDHFEKIYPPYNEVLKLRDAEFNSKPLMDVKSRAYCRLVMDEVIFCPITR